MFRNVATVSMSCVFSFFFMDGEAHSGGHGHNGLCPDQEVVSLCCSFTANRMCAKASCPASSRSSRLRYAKRWKMTSRSSRSILCRRPDLVLLFLWLWLVLPRSKLRQWMCLPPTQRLALFPHVSGIVFGCASAAVQVCGRGGAQFPAPRASEHPVPIGARADPTWCSPP